MRLSEMCIGKFGWIAIVAAVGIVSMGEAYAQSAQRGLIFARTNCARCHSIDKVTESPLKIAPPFRTLHNRYPVESLEESLAEGIVTGHQNMPEFRLERDQIGDFIAYFKTLE
jgi:mono/diheme cytochrome c family protein